MFIKKIFLVLIISLFYQTSLYSKSNSFKNLDSKNLSKYFSGIVAFENKDNSLALDFFNSSKILLNEHDEYLKRYVYSLVLENKVSQAINTIKNSKGKNSSNFFDAKLLLVLDSLKKNNLDLASNNLKNMSNLNNQDRLNTAILESLKQYIYVFKEKKILNQKRKFGKLSIISETFQRCYLKDEKTDTFFLNLINDQEADYTRYTYFYLSYLIENNKIQAAREITDNLNYINTSLLLSQGKSWIENNNEKN